MPGLLQRVAPASSCAAALGGAAGSGGVVSGGIWSKHRDCITFDQLQKFWSELPPYARQELLRIDKQTLFEQARKNLYCSRCNGLLLEGFSQIVMYSKSFHRDATGVQMKTRTGTSKSQIDKESDDMQEPSVHPWGGLSTTRDGMLTLLDCFISAKSLKAIQNVFDNARARERERELLYPDACGGGGRGWISQGMVNYGRGHGTRETCALHTARLSCDTLVDFWSALSDETRLSLLRMKEEDFIERLMYRFDSKRFCRDCRRNVIREFKELKELKRMRREPHCTSWFCVADTAFQYEVSEDTVQADWHQSFTDTAGTFHHFEWAIGTGEGKSDILEFEDVGMSGQVEVNGLDLGGLSACFITLRAWKLDGRCTELCVKAHALKGQPCVHRRLVIGDGYVTITKGENIRRFFEHAEEAEEEEDDDAMDKDGNEYDGDGSRPQKHAKSPELAREFLLDAATVIFKEQVEKAFREGTARQNAHSIFVCLALKLLEERVHVACKEIITLEKQNKLLEEEENEKREEEERKERRRTKEREKKHRRKERLKGKERERDRKHIDSNSLDFDLMTSENDLSMITHDGAPNTIDSGDSISDQADNAMLGTFSSPDNTDEHSSNGGICIESMDSQENDNQQRHSLVEPEFPYKDSCGSFILEQSKSSRRKLRFKRESLVDQDSKWYDKRRSIGCHDGNLQHDESDMNIGDSVMASRSVNGINRPSRGNAMKANARICNLKFTEKFHCSSSRIRDRHNGQFCGCNQHGDYRGKDGYQASAIRSGREVKAPNRKESTLDMPKPFYRSIKYSYGCYVTDNGVMPKGKLATSSPHRDLIHTRQVWEPTDARKKCPRSNSDPDISSRTAIADRGEEPEFGKDENGFHLHHNSLDQPDDNHCLSEHSKDSGNSNGLCSYSTKDDDGHKSLNKSDPTNLSGCSDDSDIIAKSDCYSEVGKEEEVDSCAITSTFPRCDPTMGSASSDNCSSCLSEIDSSRSSSSAQNTESSSTSDSEDASPISEARDSSTCKGNDFQIFPEGKLDQGDLPLSRTATGFGTGGVEANIIREGPRTAVHVSDSGGFGSGLTPLQQHILPVPSQSIHVPVFPTAAIRYHTQSASSWSAAPTTGLMPFPQPNHYVFPSPLRYGLSANKSSDFCMQFNPLQHLPSPAYNVSQHPPFRTSNRIDIMSDSPQPCRGVQRLNCVAEPPANGHPLSRPLSNNSPSSKPAPVRQNNSVGNADGSREESPSFSLFHFGPVDGGAGYSRNLAYKEEESTGLSSKPLPVQADLTCPKQETTDVEEYSLFASSNGTRFAFF